MMDMFNEQRSSTKDDELWHAQVITIIDIISCLCLDIRNKIDESHYSVLLDERLWRCLVAGFPSAKVYRNDFTQLRRKNCTKNLFLQATYHFHQRSISRWPAAIGKIASRSSLDSNVCLFSNEDAEEGARGRERNKLTAFLRSSREINQSTWQVAFPSSFFHPHARACKITSPLSFSSTCLSLQSTREREREENNWTSNRI